MKSKSIYFIVLALTILLIQSVVIYYFGEKAVVVSTVIMAFVGGLLWQLLTILVKYTGNIQSVSPSGNLFWTAFFVFLIVLAIANFSLYYLVAYLKTSALNKPILLTWFFLVAVPPSLYFGIKGYKVLRKEKYQFENFARLPFEIFYFNEYPVWVTELVFTNTQNEKEGFAPSSRRAEFYTSELLESYAVGDVANRQNMIAFNATVEIPVGADQFTLGYYSFTEERYYLDTFKFDFQKYITVYKYTGEKRATSSRLLIKPEGHADLIVAAKPNFLIPYIKIAHSTVSPAEHLNFLFNLSIYKTDDSELDKQENINKMKASGRLQKRLDIQQRQFTWNLSVKSSGKLVNVKAEDFHYLKYSSTYNWFNKPVRRRLPSSLNFSVYNGCDEAFAALYFYFNELVLFDVVNELTQGNEDTPVTLLIEIENPTDEGVHVSVTNGSNIVRFIHFNKKIKRYENVPIDTLKSID